jgi:hypothetical protein
MNVEVTSDLTSEGEYLVGLELDGMTAVLTADEARSLSHKLMKASGEYFASMPELLHQVSELKQRLYREGPDLDIIIQLGIKTEALRAIDALLAMPD